MALLCCSNTRVYFYCILNSPCNSWRVIFAFRNSFWMKGQTFTSSSKVWLVNTRGIEVREMWFTLWQKCLTIFFSTSYVIIPTKRPWARKDYNDLGHCEQLNISFTSSLACFHYERDDWLQGKAGRIRRWPLPRKVFKNPAWPLGVPTSVRNTRDQYDMGWLVHFLEDWMWYSTGTEHGRLRPWVLCFPLLQGMERILFLLKMIYLNG